MSGSLSFDSLFNRRLLADCYRRAMAKRILGWKKQTNINRTPSVLGVRFYFYVILMSDTYY